MLGSPYHRAAVVGLLAATMAAPTAAFAQPKIGETLEEIIELAKQEPTVTLATTWAGPIIEFQKKGFKEKYGLDFEFVYVSGTKSRQRIFNESLAGVNDIDLVNMSSSLADKFVDAGLNLEIDYTKLFDGFDPKLISPDGHYLATGWNQFVFAYNKNAVSEEEVPKSFDECLDPKWKGGRIGVYTRPLAFAQHFFRLGEEKAIEYHKALKDQEPVWTSGTNATMASLAAGEFDIVCGIQYHAVKNILREDPTAPVGWIVPDIFAYQPGESLTVMADSDSPNAAVLLAAYLATDGAPGYGLYGRSNPMIEGTEAWDLWNDAGAEPYWAGWEYGGDVQAHSAKTIVEAWGFPKAE